MADDNSWIKPVIVLVPGAWNTDGCFNLLVPSLHDAGYSTRGVLLPSVGATPPTSDIQRDVDAIRLVVAREVDAGHDVLLLMHDYGCVPGGEAVKGLDKRSRQLHGLNGGVTCLFYAASPLLPLEPDTDVSWIKTSRDKTVAIPENPIDIFCPEIEPELAREYVDSLKPHSYQTFFAKTTWEPYRTIPFFCLFCRLDKMLSIEKQRALAAAPDVKFKSSFLAVGHCPFIAKPGDMANAVRRAAKESTYYGGVIARDYGLETVTHYKDQ